MTRMTLVETPAVSVLTPAAADTRLYVDYRLHVGSPTTVGGQTSVTHDTFFLIVAVRATPWPPRPP